MTGAPVLPWESEFDLGTQTARALIESQFPSLMIVSLRYLHEGWDSAAFLVNEEWVFRFPKRRERQAWLASEVAMLQLLGTRRLELSIPAPVYLGKPSSLFPCGFMGYRLLAGRQGDEVDLKEVDREVSARRLGEFLGVLHSIDVKEAESLGARRYEFTTQELLEKLKKTRETLWPALSEELREACRPFLEGTLAVPALAKRPPCLVHGDLADEHLLLDELGRITGVIDWGDACLSDPAVDFSGLYAWLGEAFVGEVLKHYSVAWDTSFLENIRFRGRCWALLTYDHSLAGRDSSRADRLRMVRTAFGVALPTS
jgi:aminoglycoside phosphotransferase (APT) family kinase protein